MPPGNLQQNPCSTRHWNSEGMGTWENEHGPRSASQHAFKGSSRTLLAVTCLPLHLRPLKAKVSCLLFLHCLLQSQALMRTLVIAGGSSEAAPLPRTFLDRTPLEFRLNQRINNHFTVVKTDANGRKIAGLSYPALVRSRAGAKNQVPASR